MLRLVTEGTPRQPMNPLRRAGGVPPHPVGELPHATSGAHRPPARRLFPRWQSGARQLAELRREQVFEHIALRGGHPRTKRFPPRTGEGSRNLPHPR
eukprot:scaffold17307_cov119-Isochrysis_galbana.AAC.4